MRNTVTCVLVALTMALPSSALAQETPEDCFQATMVPDKGERSIEVCTRVLDRGNLKGATLATTLNNRGLGYLKNKQLDRAMRDFDAALRAQSTNVFAIDNRGEVWRERGDFNRAIAEYTKALKVDPTFVSAYYNRALAHEKLGNVARARADYEATIDTPGRGRELDRWAKDEARKRLVKLKGQ